MARYTTAYSSFLQRLEEVKLLRDEAARRERIDPIRNSLEITVLCRASIVLLCAHLEAYVKQLGEITLINMHQRSASRAAIASQFFYHVSQDIIRELKDSKEPCTNAEKIFEFIESDLVHWNRKGSFSEPLPVDRFNQGFSNPKFNKICTYLNRFGYDSRSYKNDLATCMKAQYQATINMIDHLVDVRNKIAHGELGVTKTPTDIHDMVEITSKFCRWTDIVFANWCKLKLCTIR